MAQPRTGRQYRSRPAVSSRSASSSRSQCQVDRLPSPIACSRKPENMSESETVAKAEVAKHLGELQKPAADVDIDVAETQEWLASLDYVLKSKGADRGSVSD